MSRTLHHLSVDLQSVKRRMRAPFMAEGAKTGINPTRIAEALIIAVFTSLIVYISSVPKLETRLDSVEAGLKDFKSQVSVDVGDVKDEVKELRRDLYVPAAARQHTYPLTTPTTPPAN